MKQTITEEEIKEKIDKANDIFNGLVLTLDVYNSETFPENIAATVKLLSVLTYISGSPEEFMDRVNLELRAGYLRLCQEMQSYEDEQNESTR